MPQPFRPLFTEASYISLVNQAGNFIQATQLFLTTPGSNWSFITQNLFIENTQIEVLNQLILKNNVGETDTQNLFATATNTQLLVAQQNDAFTLWENIAENLFAIASQMAGIGGAVDLQPVIDAIHQIPRDIFNVEALDLSPIVTAIREIPRDVFQFTAADLSTTESFLSSILRDTSNIALSMGGGAPLGFGDIVGALNAQTQHFDFWAFQNLHPHLINLSQSSVKIAGKLGEIDNSFQDGITFLANVLLDLVRVTAAKPAGVIDPATQKIADATEIDTLAQLLAGSLGNQLSQPDADEYLDWIINSGPLALLGSGGKIAKAILGFAGRSVTSTAGLAALAVADQAITGGKITAQLTDSTLWALGRGVGYVTGVAEKILSMVQTLDAGVSPRMQAFFGPQMEKMLNDNKAAILALGEVGPTGGFSAAQRLLSQASINGMRAQHMSTAMEMIPFAKQFGVTQLSSFMADMAGFGAMASGTWGQAVSQAVGRPAGYELNASTRSRLPDPRQLEQLVFEGQLSEADQATILAFYGFNDDWIRRMQTIQFIEPNLRQLSSLAADASMPEAQTETWLREIGFSPKDASALLPIIMQQSMRSERSALQSEVLFNLRSGLLEEDDAEFYFDKLRLHPLARDMLLTTGRLGLRRNSIEDNIATHRQLFNDGLLDESDFRLGLQAQGVTAPRITVELDQVASKRFAKIADTEAAETKSEVRKQQGLLISAMREAFQHGFIDRNQFEQTLVHGGITSTVAAATVELETIKLQGRALTSRSAEAARLLQREQGLREDTFVELFRKSAINNWQLQRSLLGVGLPEAVVNAIVERELARIRPTPADLLRTPGALKAKELTTLAKARLQVLFAKAAIDANNYLTQLVALGVDAEIARATVALEVARRSGELQRPASATVDRKALSELRKKVEDALATFAQSSQTQAALKAVLGRLSLAEEVIDALVARANEAIQAAAAAETAVS